MLRRVFPILALCMFSSVLGMGIINPLLPLYVNNLGATGTELGIIFAAYGATNAFAGPVIGRLSDKHGRKIFLCIGLFCYSAISIAYVLATNIPLLTLVRAVQGLMMGMTLPIAQAYIADISPEGEEGKWMGYSQAAFFSGFSFGPLMGGVLADRFDMNAAFFAMGGFNLFAFLVALFFLPELGQHKKRANRPHLSFREMGGSQMVKGLFSFRMVQALGRGATMTFLPLFAAQRAGMNTTQIGLLLSINVFLISIISLPGGKLADRFNRKNLTILGNLLFLTATFLFPFTHSFWQLLALSPLQSLGEGIAMPASTALTVEEGRKFGMGSTIAVFTLAMSIGMSIGPVAAGAIVDALDINAAFYFSVLMGLIGTAIFLWFSRGYHRGKL